MPSRRHCLHWEPVSRAMLDAPPLAGPAAVVSLRRHVPDPGDLEPGGLERADRRLAPGARALHEHLDLLEAVLHALARGGVCRHLRGEGRGLAGALEAGAAGGLPRDHVAVLVGQRHDRVVEARLDVRLPEGHVLSDASAPAGPTWLRHLELPHLLLAAAGRGAALRALAGARVRLRPLAVDRQAAPVAQAPVRADLHEALDVLRLLTAKVALHHQVVDALADEPHLVLCEVLDLRVRLHAGLDQNLVRGRPADAVHVREPYFDPLVEGDVDPGYACH